MRYSSTWMFLPGSEERFLSKIPNLRCDALFLDLEDGVPRDKKAAARSLIESRISTLSGSADTYPELYVRINPPHTSEAENDLEMLAGVEGLTGVCIPKVEEAIQVQEIADFLASTSNSSGEPLNLVAAIESAKGLVRVADIAVSSDSLAALMFGAEDFALDLSLPALREKEAEDLIFARSAIAVAAAAGNLQAIDSVFANLDDTEGLKRDSLLGRRLGMTGKSLFHPSQITPIKEVFAASEDELLYARRVVAAFDEAVDAGAGAVAVDGRLIDLPIVERARRQIADVGPYPDSE